MATFAFLCLGCEGFLSFCVMITAGLAICLLVGRDAFEGLIGIFGSVLPVRTATEAEGLHGALWPLTMYGTGPPAKGP
jgi:hypothetical protein